MTTRWWIVIVVAGLGTLALRASVWVLLPAARQLPRWVTQALSLLPAAAMAGLVAPALLMPAGVFDPWAPTAFAGLIALAVAFRTRNVLLTLFVGFSAAVLFEALLG